MGDRHWVWKRCCGSIFCSNGSISPTQRWKTHFMTLNRCAALPGLNWARTRCLTIVDATIVSAPRSKKNGAKELDPEMSSTRKGTDWFFGMKLHVGTDTRGVAHTAIVTTAKVHDSQLMEDLLHGKEKVIYGDRAYINAELQQDYEAEGVRWRIQRRGQRNAPLSERDRQWNRRQSKVRARVEHIFHVIKQLWGHRKVRYRGLAKNEAHYFSLLALADLFLVRKQLLLKA